MGGSKPTKAKVTTDLRSTLFTNANDAIKDASKKISNPASPPSEANLESALAVLANQYFHDAYGYDYNGTSSSITDSDRITTAKVQAAEGYCSIDPSDSKPISQQINDYLDDKFFSVASIESWMRDSAQADLRVEGQGLCALGDVFQNQWSHADFKRTYNSPNPPDNSVRVNGEFLYCNASLTESGVTSTFTVIYLIGVYYEIKSPLEIAGQDLLKTLYDNANSLVENRYAALTAPKFQDLEKVLKDYGESQFHDLAHFSYDGDTSVPTDLAPGGWVGGTEVGSYIQTTDPTVFAEQLKTLIVDAINISGLNSDIQTGIQNGLKDVGELLAKTPQGTSWNKENFETTYIPKDPDMNSVKTIGKFVYCNATLHENNVTAYVTYAYYVGVYYEIISPIKYVRQQLIKTLCTNANSLLGNKYTIPNDAKFQLLETMMQDYGEQKFQSYAGFAYKGTASKPSDIISGHNPRGASVSGYVEKAGETVKNLETSLETSIFEAAGISESDALKSSIAATISTEMDNIFSESFDDSVGHKELTDTYSWPNNTTQQLKIVAEFIYCNATATHENVVYKMMYVYFVGLFYAVTYSSTDGF